MEKVKIKVDERVFRNSRGDLHIGYVTRLIPSDPLKEDDTLSKISKVTGVPETKLLFILDELASTVIKSLLRGSPVEVPKLGKFSLGMRSHAVSLQKDAGVKAIDRLTINYMPTLTLKKKIDLLNIIFKQV